MKISIITKLQIEGLHCWPEAKNFSTEISYLSDLHRHIFFIECEKNVTHTDRDVEFIMFKHKISEYLSSKYYDKDYKCLKFDRMSCEDIALELMKEFNLISCYVSEDNENGAKITL